MTKLFAKLASFFNRGLISQINCKNVENLELSNKLREIECKIQALQESNKETSIKVKALKLQVSDNERLEVEYFDDNTVNVAWGF